MVFAHRPPTTTRRAPAWVPPLTPPNPVSLRRLFHLAAVLTAFALASPAIRPGLAAQSDVIRGRITNPENQPVENATITLTSIQGNVNRSTKTSKDGRFQIVFPGDEGDYFV